MSTKIETDVSIAIDLIVDAYNLTNPLEIQEKIEQTLGMEIRISNIVDYLNIEEDFTVAERFITYGLSEFVH